MAEFILKRTEQSEQGTFGVIEDENGVQVCVTCERPDNGNQKMGCIPTGRYGVTPFNSPSKGHVFLVHDVPGRSMIEIHNGNTIKDTEGCILVGKMRGVVDGMPAVLVSKPTLQAMLAKYADGFILKIVEEFNANA